MYVAVSVSAYCASADAGTSGRCGSLIIDPPATSLRGGNRSSCYLLLLLQGVSFFLYVVKICCGNARTGAYGGMQGTGITHPCVHIARLQIQCLLVLAMCNNCVAYLSTASVFGGFACSKIGRWCSSYFCAVKQCSNERDMCTLAGLHACVHAFTFAWPST